MSALINLRHLYVDDYKDGDRLLVSSIRGLGKLTALQELYFDCRGQKMGEVLADMDMLRLLEISHLEEVESMEEASKSRLDKKEDLDKLTLTWGSTDPGRVINNPGLEEEVLQSLKPASRQLTIEEYGGIRSPGWMDDLSWLSSCSSLERVELKWCTNWEVLPPLGQLPRLRFLTIWGMVRVRRVGPRFMGGCRGYADDGGGVLVGVPRGGGGFPLLEELEFEDMEEWEEWEAPPVLQLQLQQQQQFCDQYEDGTIINDDDDDDDDHGLRQKQPQQQQQPLIHPQQQQIITFLPRLRRLMIIRCPKLRQLPPLPPTLTDLEISEVGLTHLPGWGWLPPPSSTSSSSSSSSRPSPALSSLSIEKCPNLTSLADGLLRHHDLHNLRRLEIKGCQDLVSLPEETALGHLTSLEELSVEDCPKLSRPPTSSVEQLPLPSSLKSLYISGCDQVGDVLLASGVKHLTSLTDMWIAGRCRFGRRKRSAGEYSTSDDSYSGTLPPPRLMLHISSIDELDDECLSTLLRGLTSLGSLSISDCPVITSLPRAEVLSHLTALESLSIRSSRGLKSLGGIHSLVSLQSLTIDDCPQLPDIVTVIPTSTTAVAAAAATKPLRSLTIGWSSVQQMKAWLLRFPSLQELRIRDCPQLAGFGTGEGDHDDADDGGGGGSASLLETALLERFAPTLRRLVFWRCENLRSLPPNLRCLSSLEYLEVWYCPEIPSLPAGGLPESLRRLVIGGCPALAERCRRGEGADWHLVSHIDDLRIFN